MRILGLTISRAQPEQRGIQERPSTSLSNPASWLTALFGAESSAGVLVTEDNTLSLSAMWRATNVLSDAIAGLPFHVIQKTDGHWAEIDHPISYLIGSEPSPIMTSFTFRAAMMAHACLFGNAYAVINRGSDQRPESLRLLDPRNVDVKVGAMTVTYHEKSNGGTETIQHKGANVLHLMGLSTDGFMGKNVIKMHRDTLGTSIAARSYEGNFFANGAQLSGYIQYPTALKQADFERLRLGWDTRYAGNANAGKTAILDAGAEYKPLRLGPQDAGLSSTQKFSVEEVARITGVPPHMLFALDRATFNSVEQLGRAFATYTLKPWVKRIEQEFNRKLFSVQEKGNYRVRLDMNAFMRGDSKTQAEYYRTLIHAGVMTPNEVRKLEKLPPVAGGDNSFMQMNMTTLANLEAGDNLKDKGTDTDAGADAVPQPDEQ